MFKSSTKVFNGKISYGPGYLYIYIKNLKLLGEKAIILDLDPRDLSKEQLATVKIIKNAPEGRIPGFYSFTEASGMEETVTVAFPDKQSKIKMPKNNRVQPIPAEFDYCEKEGTLTFVLPPLKEMAILDTKKKKSIGYKNPPKETQFKPGQSGNPSGRPKLEEKPDVATAAKSLKILNNYLENTKEAKAFIDNKGLIKILTPLA